MSRKIRYNILSARLPANLLQGQRDFFGVHTYERVDRPRKEFFHTEWKTFLETPEQKIERSELVR